jgi:hypothetical protein
MYYLHSFCTVWPLYNIQTACFSLSVSHHQVWSHDVFKSCSTEAAQSCTHMSLPSIHSSLSVYLSFLFAWNSLNSWPGKPSWVDYKILCCHRIGNSVFGWDSITSGQLSVFVELLAHSTMQKFFFTLYCLKYPHEIYLNLQ